jgi:hypothetical protein
MDLKHFRHTLLDEEGVLPGYRPTARAKAERVDPFRE